MFVNKWKDLSNKRKISFFIFAVLAIIWMCMIYSFSAQVGDVSSKQSGTLTQKVVRVVDSDYVHPEKAKPKTFEFVAERFVRKSAHFMCYAVLASLCFFAIGMVCGVPEKKKVPFVAAFVISTVYACLDEYHQTFVDGRAGRIVDVFIDCGGVLVGILLCVLGCITYLKYMEKKNNT